jgi:hypothetical protein
MSVHPVPASALLLKLMVSNESSSRIATGTAAAALNLLGRSTDYLLRSHLTSVPIAKSDEEAVQILHRLRRQIFEDYVRSSKTRCLPTCC